MNSHTPLFAWLVRHAVATWVLMAISFVAFGALSINLVTYTFANADYLFSYGWDAFQDGGLQQLLELWLQIFVAISTYLIFKLCEHALIERIAHRTNDQHHQEYRPSSEAHVPSIDPLIE